MRPTTRLSVPALLLALCAPPAFAQAPPRFTVEEMLKLRRVSDPSRLAGRPARRLRHRPT